MKYLETSAIALILASGAAFAETHVTVEEDAGMETETVIVEDADTMAMNEGREYTVDDMYNDSANLIRTSDITGGDIYSMGEEYTGLEEGEPLENDVAGNGYGYGAWGADYTEIGEGWNDIGEIEDIVLSRDGQMIGIIAEIGGFLDIGDKHVLIPVNDVSLVPVDEQSYAYVTRMTEEQLSQLEGVDEGFWN